MCVNNTNDLKRSPVELKPLPRTRMSWNGWTMKAAHGMFLSVGEPVGLRCVPGVVPGIGVPRGEGSLESPISLSAMSPRMFAAISDEARRRDEAKTDCGDDRSDSDCSRDRLGIALNKLRR